MDPKRAYLDKIIKRKGESYRSVSVLLGRNEAYIQQYIYRTSPKNLNVEDALRIADYFDVPFASLFGPQADEFAEITNIRVPFCSDSSSYVSVDHLENYVECNPILFGDIDLRDGSFFLLRIEGHDKSPVIDTGGIALVRLMSIAWPETSGMYAIKVDGELVVRQVTSQAGVGYVIVWGDGPSYSGLAEKKINIDRVVGQVVWAANTLANVDEELQREISTGT